MQSPNEKDLASLVRVRNRLANAPDASLPKILTGLLPKLLKRLEDIHKNTSLDLRTQMQTQLVGILTHAIERVRGNDSLEVPWLSAILPGLIDAEQHLSRSMAATLIKVALFRIKQLDYNPSTTQVLLTQTLASLFQVMDKIQPFLIKAPTETYRVEVRSISWLIFDAIAIFYNMSPMVDIDLLDFDRLTYKEPDNIVAVNPEIIKIVQKDGRGVFDLFLDLFLYQCEDIQLAQMQQAISSEGRLRIWHRCNKQQQSWPEHACFYLKQLRYNCFQYCVLPNGLFQGKDTSINFKRCIMLCVLMATEHDRIGRLAADTLNKHVGRHHLVKQDNGFVSVQARVCDLSIAVSLLILVLGDSLALPVLSKHLTQKSIWEDMIGQRPCDESLQRPPLPQAGRALDFIAKHFECDKSQEKLPSLQLFLELVILTQKSIQTLNTGHTFIHLIDRLNTELEEREQSCSISSINFRKAFFDGATNVINVALDNTMTQNVRRNPEERMDLIFQQNEERLNNNAMMPLTHFRQRRDAHLANHRQSMKRKRQTLDDAVYARKTAYKLIAKLARQATIFHHSDTNTKRFSFQLPIMLFYCFQMEIDASTVSFVAKASTAVLDLFKCELYEHFNLKGDAATLQHMATNLLPAVLDTVVFYESPAARATALEWISEFLMLLDPVASLYLLKHLETDDDNYVKRKASSALLSHTHKRMTPKYTTKPTSRDSMFRFVNAESEMGIVEKEFENKLKQIIDTSRLGPHEAAIALLDNDFDMQETLRKLEADATTDSALSGMLPSSATPEISSNDNILDKTCEVCYSDDIAPSRMYSLDCSHSFCKDCWKAYIENKVTEGRNHLLNARCLSQECNARITGTTILQIAPSLTPIWERSLLASFVDRCQSFTRCPGPDCPIIVWKLHECAASNVDCTECMTSFCFTCQSEPHAPASCVEMKNWNKTMGNSKLWIKSNTKACPGCNVPIEKNHGCNHMHCSQCGFDFCWICLSRLDSHLAPHQCNRYTSSDSSEKRKKFFAERFLAHEEAEFFAKDHNTQIDDYIQKIVDKMYHFEDDLIDIIMASSKALLTARSFLKYSYVAGFGLQPDNPSLAMFQEQQGALELFVEKLSQLAIANLKAVYTEKGTTAVYKHIRSMAFYSRSVVEYMERFKDLISNISDSLV